MNRLDRFHKERGWLEVLVESRHSGPAETAASRMDFEQWLGLLSCRQRRIALFLAVGETTNAAAKKFGVTAGRISQLRRELRNAWQVFQGEASAMSIDAT